MTHLFRDINHILALSNQPGTERVSEIMRSQTIELQHGLFVHGFVGYISVTDDPLRKVAEDLIQYLNITAKSGKPLHRICRWKDCDNLILVGGKGMQGGHRFCSDECRKKQKTEQNRLAWLNVKKGPPPLRKVSA